MTVTPMPCVPTLMEVLHAPVTMDTLEMEPPVQVRGPSIYLRRDRAIYYRASLIMG